MSADEKKWQAQSDLRTLTEADSIRADKARMSNVQSHAKTQMATLSKVTGAAPAAKRPAAKPRGK
jgi:hypothetical protein